MDSTRKERMAFEKAAAGDVAYKTKEECPRGKGLTGENCPIAGCCKREWGEPGVDAQFYPVDSCFSRSAQDFPAYNRTLNAQPTARQDMDGFDDRLLSLGGDRAMLPTPKEDMKIERGGGGKSVMGTYGNPDAHTFTLCKVKFGNETARLPPLPGEYHK